MDLNSILSWSNYLPHFNARDAYFMNIGGQSLQSKAPTKSKEDSEFGNIQAWETALEI